MSKSSQKTSAPCTPQKPPHPPPNSLDIIVYEHVELQSNEDVDAVAKETLRRAIGSAGPGAAGKSMIYGNQAGRGILEVVKRLEGLVVNSQTEIADLRAQSVNHQAKIANLQAESVNLQAENVNKGAQIANLQAENVNKGAQIANLQAENVNKGAQIANLQAENVNKGAQIANLQAENVNKGAQIANLQVESADNRAEIANLQDCVQSLTQEAKGYRRIRHRFINVYRRDVLEEKVDDGRRERIDEGNRAAHRGDAITDATLYTTEEREDQYDLIHIYGLTADQISLLSHAGDYPSISVLNAGASWRAKGTTNVPVDVAAALYTFTVELIENLNEGLTNQSLITTTALGRARIAFWSAHNRGLRQRGESVTV